MRRLRLTLIGCLGLLTVAAGASPHLARSAVSQTLLAPEARPSQDSSPAFVVDPQGQRFTVSVRSGLAPGSPMTLAITNPTSQPESLKVKDQDLHAFALIPQADERVFEDGLDSVGAYHELICAGQSLDGNPSSPLQNPIPNGSCGLTLDLIPGPSLATAGSGQVAVLGPGTTTTYTAGTAAPPFVPYADIHVVLISFIPYTQSAQTPVPPSSGAIQPRPAPPSGLPIGTWTCTARAPIFVRHVRLMRGDRMVRAQLTTGGPALQLEIRVAFDGPINSGPIQPAYQVDIRLSTAAKAKYHLTATYRRGQDPTGSLDSALGPDASAQGSTLAVRTPLSTVTKLRHHLRWSVLETVNEGPRQTKVFAIECGPVTTS